MHTIQAERTVTKERMTRILLYSIEPILTAGLEQVLWKVGGFDLMYICSGLGQVMEQLGVGGVDLALLDITPEITFQALVGIKGVMGSARIVLWARDIPTELGFQAMTLGMHGILRKTLPPDLQVKCLQRVQAGELWFEKALTDSFISGRRVSLTRREGQLVSLVAQGLKNKEIAWELGISEGTVKIYCTRLFQKLRIKDRYELAIYGLKNLTPAGQSPVSGSHAPAVVEGLRTFMMHGAGAGLRQ